MKTTNPMIHFALKIFRFILITAVVVVILIAGITVYSRTDRLLWTTQLNGLIGHPLKDVVAMNSPKTGVSMVESPEELELTRRFFYPKTALEAKGKVAVMYRHEFPGQWQALVFFDRQDNVYAIQVGSLDTYGLELANRKHRK